ncbi:MAG: vWA domain-containing protein, partial [Thermoguttaceae bacterium]
MRQIILDPYIPLGLWVPLALAAAGLWAWYALASRRRLGRRWPAVMTLMGLVLVIPLVLLLNPTWVQRIPPPAGKPLLSILVDGSASMATADAEEGQTRYAQAERLAVECARRLEDRFEIRLRTFAENSSPQSPEGLKQVKPDGAGTDLAAVVEAALDDQRAQGQAMLLLSDGIHNGPGGLAVVRQSVAKARAMAAPVYVKTLGRATEVRDLEIRLKNPQELAFPRHKVPLVVTVEQRG